MAHYIPAEITDREKQGFSAPDASWFKGESIDYVRSQLFNNHARIYEFLDSGSIQCLIVEHLTGKQNRRLLIWSLLNIEWWLRKFLI
jgi:asparagine synthase (glutamine-hydrolysing)